MVESEIRIRTADGTIPVLVVHPDGQGPFPVAVLYMDGIGYREQIKENARRFAADSYYCVSRDLCYASRAGLTLDTEKLGAEGMEGLYGRRLMEVVGNVTPERARADAKPIFAGDRARPCGRVRLKGGCDARLATIGVSRWSALVAGKSRSTLPGAALHQDGTTR